MKVTNKKAGFNYEILEKIEAGIALIGSEAKAARLGKVKLDQAHARVIGNEVFLVNAQIDIENKKDYSPTRTRKLLLHREEIISINAKIKGQNLTLVPLSLYNKQGKIKLELGLARSKRSFEKRDSLKKKDVERELAREFKTKL